MIKLNEKYYLDNDPYNIILKEKKINKKGKNIGKETYKVIGYYSSVEWLYRAVIEKEILEDIGLLTNLEKIMELLNEITRKGESK